MPFAGLKVGALAKRAGVTVRTLHHYDRIGLVVPTARTGSGHRLYGERDIQRLARVMLLRGLGMPLDAIGDCLSRRDDSGTAVHDLLQRHVLLLRQRMKTEAELCARMEGLLHLMKSRRSAERFSAGDLLDLMELLTMIESYYTPEQLEQLKQRREALGEDGMKAAEKEWPELIKKMTAEMNAGTDPADPRVQLLARRWKELVASFTGGDPGIAQSLGKMWKEKGPEMAGKMGMGFDPKLFEYVGKAQKSLSA